MSWVLCLWLTSAGLSLFATGLAVMQNRRDDEVEQLPPVPEIVPYAIWRDNLEAALSEMTLQNPTIDYNRVNSWTPYAESMKFGYPTTREYQEEMIRKSLRGTQFLEGGHVEQINVNLWGRQEPIRTEYRHREPAVVIDTAEMVAATSDHDFNLACERAAVASMVGLESLPAAERYRRLLAEKGIIV